MIQLSIVLIFRRTVSMLSWTINSEFTLIFLRPMIILSFDSMRSPSINIFKILRLMNSYVIDIKLHLLPFLVQFMMIGLLILIFVHINHRLHFSSPLSVLLFDLDQNLIAFLIVRLPLMFSLLYLHHFLFKSLPSL
jgi:hypothetical protein